MSRPGNGSRLVRHSGGGVGSDVPRGPLQPGPPVRVGCRSGLPNWRRPQRRPVMESPVFEDLSAFIEAWLSALDRLKSRDGQIVFDYATRRSTMAELAAAHGLSRERVRQIVDHHFGDISAAHGNCDGPIGRAVGSLGRWAERAGLELAYRFRRCRAAQADQFARQLINLSALRPAQRPWLSVAWALLPTPASGRPSLKRVYPEAERALWEAATPLSPQEVREALSALDPVMAEWPRLDLESHLLAVSGVAPGQDTGRYNFGRDWKTGYRRDRLLIRYYMARALEEAGRCMTIGELAEWDVGHANPKRDGHSRHGLAGEILHRLDGSPAPVHLSEMRGHLKARFAATRGCQLFTIWWVIVGHGC